MKGQGDQRCPMAIGKKCISGAAGWLSLLEHEILTPRSPV